MALASLTKQDALKIFVLGLFVFLFAEEMPFEFMAKASRMVKIEKEQISEIKLKSTVPFFLLYPVCYEIQYFVLNDDAGASKTMALASSKNGYLSD